MARRMLPLVFKKRKYKNRIAYAIFILGYCNFSFGGGGIMKILPASCAGCSKIHRNDRHPNGEKVIAK